jgi:hypothetical protein
MGAAEVVSWKILPQLFRLYISAAEIAMTLFWRREERGKRGTMHLPNADLLFLL